MKSLAEIKLRNLQEEAMMARASNNCERLLELKVEIAKLELEINNRNMTIAQNENMR